MADSLDGVAVHPPCDERPALWLVTSSPNYYPDSGTGDWKILTPDESAARAALAALAPSTEECGVLVAIYADGRYETLGERWTGDPPEAVNPPYLEGDQR